MGKRIFTGIVAVIALFLAVLINTYVLYAAVMLVTLFMLYELYRVLGTEKVLRYTGYVISATIFLGTVSGKNIYTMATAVLLLYAAILFAHKSSNSKDVMSAGFLTISISFMMSMLVMIRKEFDQYTVLLPFVCACLCDTGAYFTGMLLGKHKLAESVSPKKTVEGAIGGLIFSTLGAMLYIIIMTKIMASGMPAIRHIIKFGIIGFAGGIISQIGDLVASCIKRDFGKKDYGNILMGHGGFMDRLDSVVVVIPFIYYAMRYFIF